MRFGNKSRASTGADWWLAYEGTKVVGFISRYPETHTDKSPYQVFKAGNATTGTPAVLLANVWSPKVFARLSEVRDDDCAGGLTEAKATLKRLLA